MTIQEAMIQVAAVIAKQPKPQVLVVHNRAWLEAYIAEHGKLPPSVVFIDAEEFSK